MARRTEVLVGARRLALTATMALAATMTLGACQSQADDLQKQLEQAGYTAVDAYADFDSKTKKSGKTNKPEVSLDDFEATARAGACEVAIEQDAGSVDFVVEKVNDTEVDEARTKNLTSEALIEYVRQEHGISC